MIPLFGNLRDMNVLSVVVRMLFACLCGFVIGMERSAKNRPAGFRTHILVCLGSATAALAGLYIYFGLGINTDITRISAQVVSGLGFIGAGTIIVTKNLDIRGLTTAAGLWVTGIVGLAIGSGFYEGGIIGTALILFVEAVLTKLAGRIQRRPRTGLRILYSDKNALDLAYGVFRDKKMHVSSVKIDMAPDGGTLRYRADVMLRGSADMEALTDSLEELDGVVSAAEL